MAVPAVALVASLAEEVANWAKPPSAIMVAEPVATFILSVEISPAVSLPEILASEAWTRLPIREPVNVAF